MLKYFKFDILNFPFFILALKRAIFEILSSLTTTKNIVLYYKIV